MIYFTNRTEWDYEHLESLTNGNTFCMMNDISRKEIEQQDISSMLKILYPLKRPIKAIRYFERLNLCISGYNNDKRELWEIPEVRSYIRLLDEKFPYWFYFSSRIAKIPLFVFVTFCLCNVEGNVKRLCLLRDDTLKECFTKHYNAMMRMCRNTGFSDEKTNELANNIFNYYQ